MYRLPSTFKTMRPSQIGAFIAPSSLDHLSLRAAGEHTTAQRQPLSPLTSCEATTLSVGVARWSEPPLAATSATRVERGQKSFANRFPSLACIETRDREWISWADPDVVIY